MFGNSASQKPWHCKGYSNDSLHLICTSYQYQRLCLWDILPGNIHKFTNWPCIDLESNPPQYCTCCGCRWMPVARFSLPKSLDVFVPIAKCICPNFKMYCLKLHLLWLLSVASQVQDGLSKLSKIFVPIAKCICPSFQMYLLRLRLLWLLPARFSRDDLPKGRFCGRHIVHKNAPYWYFVRQFIESTAMALLTERNILEFKERGFTQASKEYSREGSVFSIMMLHIFCLQM